MMNENRAESHSVNLIKIQLHIWAFVDAAGANSRGQCWTWAEAVMRRKERNASSCQSILHKMTAYQMVVSWYVFTVSSEDLTNQCFQSFTRIPRAQLLTIDTLNQTAKYTFWIIWISTSRKNIHEETISYRVHKITCIITFVSTSSSVLFELLPGSFVCWIKETCPLQRHFICSATRQPKVLYYDIKAVRQDINGTQGNIKRITLRGFKKEIECKNCPNTNTNIEHFYLLQEISKWVLTNATLTFKDP